MEGWREVSRVIENYRELKRVITGNYGRFGMIGIKRLVIKVLGGKNMAGWRELMWFDL